MVDEAMRKMDAIDRKVDRLETDVNEMKTAQAVRDEQFRSIGRQLDGVEKQVGEVKGGINKVLWALALVVLGAFANFVLRGGLTMMGSG